MKVIMAFFIGATLASCSLDTECKMQSMISSSPGKVPIDRNYTYDSKGRISSFITVFQMPSPTPSARVAFSYSYQPDKIILTPEGERLSGELMLDETGKAHEYRRNFSADTVLFEYDGNRLKKIISEGETNRIFYWGGETITISSIQEGRSSFFVHTISNAEEPLNYKNKSLRFNGAFLGPYLSALPDELRPLLSTPTFGDRLEGVPIKCEWVEKAIPDVIISKRHETYTYKVEGNRIYYNTFSDLPSTDLILSPDIESVLNFDKPITP